MDYIHLLKDRSLLITGGTGSFGRALARRLLSENACRKVIIFSRDEWKQWDMKQSDPIFAHPKIRYFLGDVRDETRLQRAFHEVDFVIHAAALKQVPAAEYNPTEAVKTNVIGAMNVVNAAIDGGVRKVIALSTDKAVNPVNLYGATKLCADKLFVAGNVYVGARGFPSFSVVRYGNVIGSRGSIIPYWQKMIAEGVKALPITDEQMTRFWITLDQAVDFVLTSLVDARGGEIYVPKIPSMRIIDLAKAVAPHLPLEICGIRPGEKLHEMMIHAQDASHTIECPKHFVVLPEAYDTDALHRLKIDDMRGGHLLPYGHTYSSDRNTEWLDVPTIQKYLAMINSSYKIS